MRLIALMVVMVLLKIIVIAVQPVVLDTVILHLHQAIPGVEHLVLVVV